MVRIAPTGAAGNVGRTVLEAVVLRIGWYEPRHNAAEALEA